MTASTILTASRGERTLTVREIRLLARCSQGAQGRVLGQQVPHAGLVQAGTQRPFQGRRDAGQSIAAPVGQSGLVRGQVDVETVEDPEAFEELVGAGIEPVHLFASGPAGIGDHVGVAFVGLGLARIQVGGPAHHQPRHVRHRQLSASSHGQGELSDRAGLVDHQSGRAVLGGPVQQRLQGGLVVDQAAGEEPLASVVEDLGEVLLLADVQPDPHVHLAPAWPPAWSPFLVPVSTCSGRPSMVRSPSSTLRTSDQAACPHQRFTHRPRRRQHPPGHQPLQGAMSHTDTAGLPRPQSCLPGPTEEGKGAALA